MSDALLHAGFRAQMRDRILAAEALTDRQTKAAVSLLSLTVDREISIAHWIAYDLLEVTATEWAELLTALEQAGVLRIEKQNDYRSWLRWTVEP